MIFLDELKQYGELQMKHKRKIERKIRLQNWKVVIRDETRIVNELK